MKLYFAPGACSLSPHIVLQEAGIAAETEQVDNKEKKTKSGKDYWTINPKGQVPALQLDSGEMLNFITSELHKSFGPIFRPTTPDAYKAISKENIGKRFDWVDKQLAGRQYLMGDKFTVADAYLFTVLRWSSRVDIDVAKWPNLKAYMDRVGARPKVQAAMKAEGLIS
jgi:glutathione S-transferase